MSEQADEFYRLQVESHSRFVYFLLGVAALSIAFAIHESRGQALALAHVPIGAAVLCWGASFAAGASGLARRQKVLRGNSEMSKLLGGLVSPPVADVPRDFAVAALREAIDAESKAVASRWNWQQWLLFAGAVSYVAGHVMGMAMIAGG
jgi:hypothetical protein